MLAGFSDMCTWWQSYLQTPCKHRSRPPQRSWHSGGCNGRERTRAWAQRSQASRRWWFAPWCGQETRRWSPWSAGRCLCSTWGCTLVEKQSSDPVWAGWIAPWNRTRRSHLSGTQSSEEAPAGGYPDFYHLVCSLKSPSSISSFGPSSVLVWTPSACEMCSLQWLVFDQLWHWSVTSGGWFCWYQWEIEAEEGAWGWTSVGLCFHPPWTFVRLDRWH